MNLFCFVGIYAVLAMLILMIKSSIADKFEIFVRGDKNTSVFVEETDTVSKLKQNIVEQLAENIKKETKRMELQLKTCKKGIAELKAELEQKYDEMEKIETERITLRSDENCSPLEDNKTMKDCGIVKGTNPKIVFLRLDEFEIKVEGDKNDIVYVKDTDSVLKVKYLISDKLVETINEEIGIIMKELREETKEDTKSTIFIKTKLIGVNKRIDELKAKLKEKENEKIKICNARITMRLDKNGSPLENGKTMKDYGIGKGTIPKIVYLTLDELEIEVIGAKRTTVYVKDTDTVSTVRKKIEDNESDTLRLYKSGYPHNPLEDGKTMKECGIVKKKVEFFALEVFEIFVHYKGKKYTVWAHDKDTVSELKQLIEKVIGINPTNQILTLPTHDEEVILDDTKTMDFYKIGKDAELSLKRELSICFKYKHKKYFPILEETEKVSTVKEKVKEMINQKIKDKNGIPLQKITFKYDGKVLDDNAEIGSYNGIYSKATVYVDKILSKSYGNELTSPLLND
ncbi:hypothetical protein niasHT_006162 [Heterodera trifolii]|uniref:Ubiquitin-like domain-containing protein n=1 Tax=Heterodera trifolii TaxID=157864 RepID=A0ABD2M2H5_9BILA